LNPVKLRKIYDVSDQGIPSFDGENRRVVAVQKFRLSDVGKVAACQDLVTEDDAVLALGVLEETDQSIEGKPVNEQPLVLRSGESSLTMTPDGTIRIEGSRFDLRTTGNVKIMGAIVELN